MSEASKSRTLPAVEDKTFAECVNQDCPVECPDSHALYFEEESVAVAYPIPVLELAAQAEAPIGKSVVDFLMKNPPRLSSTGQAKEVGMPEVDDWQNRCREDFGREMLSRCDRSMPGWKKMTWEQRHAKLKEQKEVSGDGW